MTSGLLDAGRALHQAGKLAEAEAKYRRLLSSEPDNVQALHLLWAALAQQGNFIAALEAIEAAVKLWPSDATLWHSLGTAFMDVARTVDAESAYRRALQIRPDLADAHFSLGYLLENGKRPLEAEQSLRQTVRLAPEDPHVHNHLGIVLLALGRPEEAAGSLRKALAISPNSSHARGNFGAALRALGRLTEAEDAYRHALRLNPKLADAHSGLAEVLADLSRHEEAIESHQAAIRCEPRNPVAHAAMALALMRTGCLAEAESEYRQALELRADLSVHSDLLLLSNYRSDRTLQDLYAEHRKFGDRFAHGLSQMPFGTDRDPDRPLRVGYLSGDLRQHSVAFFLEPVLAAHAGREFQITCYQNSHGGDATTTRLQSHVRRWRSVMDLPDAELARLIRDDAIDILVDLSGHTANNRLPVFALKPAPIQATWLGYPTRTGLQAIDYRITDSLVDEPASPEPEAERPARLAASYFCFGAPREAPDPGPLPAAASGRVVFGSFNNLTKVNDATIALWSRALHAVPHARLLVKSAPLADAWVRARLQDRFAAHGIGGDRLLLHERQATIGEHLDRYRQVDIGLDTYPYNGATTTCEALWMGVPVISLCGETHASRMGRSILTTAGLGEFVCSNEEAFVAKCVATAGDLHSLAALRGKLRERTRSSRLMDAARFTRNLEEVYRQMWRNWCSGR